MTNGGHSTALAAIQSIYERDERDFAKADNRYKRNDMVGQSILTEAVGESTRIALAHLEEIFCDLFGLALFGASFLRAFAYMLSPGIGSERELSYPTHAQRATILLAFAEKKMQIRLGAAFKNQFDQSHPSLDKLLMFELRVAEETVSGLTEHIWDKIDALMNSAEHHRPNSSRMQVLLERLRRDLPSADAQCLGDIVNASWARFDEIVKKPEKFDRLSESIDALNEMGLKTVEALEYRLRVKR